VIKKLRHYQSVVDNFLLIITSRLLPPSSHNNNNNNNNNLSSTHTTTYPIPKSTLPQTTTSHSQWVPSSPAYVVHLKDVRRHRLLTAKQIKGVFQAIGRCLMAIVNAIGSIFQAISTLIYAFLDFNILTIPSQRHCHRL
jgi:hypothetical protein